MLWKRHSSLRESFFIVPHASWDAHRVISTSFEIEGECLCSNSSPKPMSVYRDDIKPSLLDLWPCSLSTFQDHIELAFGSKMHDQESSVGNSELEME